MCDEAVDYILSQSSSSSRANFALNYDREPQDDNIIRPDSSFAPAEVFDFPESSQPAVASLPCRKTSRARGYSERDIDAEIERCRLNDSSQTANESLIMSQSICPSNESFSFLSKTESSDDFRALAEKLRQQREEEIYRARRIFITGGSTTSSQQSGPSCVPGPSASNWPENHGERPSAKLNTLVDIKSLHSLDILSPETREKIRQFKADGQHFSAVLNSNRLFQHNTTNDGIMAESSSGQQPMSTSCFGTIAGPTHNLTARQPYLNRSNDSSAHSRASPLNVLPPLTSDYYSSANDSPSSVSYGDPAMSCLLSAPVGSRPLSTLNLTPRSFTFDSCTASIATRHSSSSPVDRSMLLTPHSADGSSSCPKHETSAGDMSDDRSMENERNLTTTTSKKSPRMKNDDEESQNLHGQKSSGHVLTSRLAQRIKFRSKSSTAEKRKNDRRHTVANASEIEEAKKCIVDNKENSKSGTADKNRRRSSFKTAGELKESGGCKKQGSKKRKFKLWFKEQLRKSSPDLSN